MNNIIIVYKNIDECIENGHQLIEEDVEFSFYTRPNKRFPAKRCSRCQQVRFSMGELKAMMNNYGVPKIHINYENEGDIWLSTVSCG